MTFSNSLFYACQLKKIYFSQTYKTNSPFHKKKITGREVVFQCRDEGPVRAKVRWTRGRGMPLPPGTRDVNGRLEIPNIRYDHSGEYVCEAIGYPKSTPGSHVSVNLQVEKCEYDLNLKCFART